MTDIISAFAHNLKLFRTKANLSQEELADLAGLHRTYIGSVERGERNISLRNVEKLAKVLKVDPSVLLKESEHRTKK